MTENTARNARGREVPPPPGLSVEPGRLDAVHAFPNSPTVMSACCEFTAARRLLGVAGREGSLASLPSTTGPSAL